jgi:hypothetical protein
MMPELWMSLAGLFLAVAAAASIAARLRPAQRWDYTVMSARGVGAIMVSVTIGLMARTEMAWPPLGLRQATPALVLAMLLLQLGLGLRLGKVGAGPVVDLIALMLIPLPLFGGLPAGSPLECTQLLFPYQTAWVFLVSGAGSAVVSGSSGILLLIGHGNRLGGRLSWLDGASLRDLMVQAALISTVSLGVGLAVGVWWAWRTIGALTHGEPHAVIGAIVWLFAAMTLLALQFRRDGERWAAALAVLAAIAALGGLLAF